MDRLPNMASISDLKHRHLDVIAQLGAGPVVIANRNQPVGVLIAPEEWNALAEELEDLRDSVSALSVLLEIEKGERETVELTAEDLHAWAAGDVVAS